jgi:hypothetical protein
VRAKSYLTHKAGLSTDFSHEDGQIQLFRQVHPMRFAALVAAFLIGLITGFATTPDPRDSSGDQLQRRQIDVKEN